MELGIWPIKHQAMYQRLMLLKNLMTSLQDLVEGLLQIVSSHLFFHAIGYFRNILFPP